MSKLTETFLDIETNAAPWERSRVPILIGFSSASCGLIQLVGSDITKRRLGALLPTAGRLYTFNGTSFDIPSIRAFLGFDLAARFQMYDLRWICRRVGIIEPQKQIEKKIGFPRKFTGINGSHIPDLWRRHLNGDLTALERILNYNAEDVEALKHIRRYLARLN